MHLVIRLTVILAVGMNASMATFPWWMRLCGDYPEERASNTTATRLPTGCMSLDSRVYCQDSTFAEIPSTFPTTTTCLVLDGCSLSQLSASDLEYLTSLTSFAVVNSQLTNVIGAFGGDTNKLTKLVFRRTKLSQFPFPGQSIRTLEVSSSLIQILDTTSLSSTYISSLNISNNPFDLRTESLNGLPVTLQELYMTNCAISIIQEGTFPSLPKLSTLGISSLSIHMNAFKGVSSVNNLRLQTCHIKTYALQDLKSIVTLNLDRSCNDGAGHLVLEKYAFSGMDKLAQLNLDSTGVELIPTKAFSGLPQILYITIRNNPLRTVMQGAFDGLGSLMEVYISHVTREKSEQNIVLLGDNTFSYANLSNLRILDISSLNLWNVTPPTLMNIPFLMDVSLNGNMLHFLLDGTFSNLSHIHTINLGDNPWNCDCHLRWLKEMTDSQPQKFRDLPLVKCAAPAHLAGYRFSELAPEDFQCPSVAAVG